MKHHNETEKQIQLRYATAAPGRYWGKNFSCELDKGHLGMSKLRFQQPLPSVEARTDTAGMGWL